MCGIAGIYNPCAVNVERSVIQRMSDSLIHRGPDDAGFYYGHQVHLAIRRLSIIDLPGGSQPIYNFDRSRCIIFNGEIHNYRVLRKELLSLGKKFATNSDTEVILQGYDLWQEEVLDRLEGMFSICIWDIAKKELFLARDRFGIKPLYYTQLNDQTLIFASEIKAILKYPAVVRRLCPQSVEDLLRYGFTAAPYTFFEGIKQLLPGHYMKVSGQDVVYRQYWDIDLEAPLLEQDDDALIEAFREKLKASVANRIVSDVDVAAYLSGGIDSSAAVSTYTKLAGNNVKTFSILFDDPSYDESLYSRMVADSLHTQHTQFTCKLQEGTLRKIIYYQENPLLTLLNLPLFLLSKQVHGQGCKVALSGDGADEILGGYEYFRILKAVGFIEGNRSALRFGILKKLFPAIKTQQDAQDCYTTLKKVSSEYPVSHPAIPYQFKGLLFVRNIYSSNMQDILTKQGSHEPFYFDPRKLEKRSLLDQALYIEIKMRLLNFILPLSDTMSMAHSVELRPVFLNHELVNFIFRIPDRLKIRGLNEKYILKKAMQAMLPVDICRRTKQGLQPPARWVLEQESGLLQEYLSEDKIKRNGYLSPEFMRLAFSEFAKNSSSDFSGIIVIALFIQLWHEIFIEQN